MKGSTDIIMKAIFVGPQFLEVCCKQLCLQIFFITMSKGKNWKKKKKRMTWFLVLDLHISLMEPPLKSILRLEKSNLQISKMMSQWILPPNINLSKTLLELLLDRYTWKIICIFFVCILLKIWLLQKKYNKKIIEIFLELYKN